jgi:phosphate transport system permease protein
VESTETRTPVIYEDRIAPVPEERAPVRARATDLTAQGEPYLWSLGGALATGILMIVGFLILVFYNGVTTFYPRPVAVVTLRSGELIAGEPSRWESYRPQLNELEAMTPAQRAAIEGNDGYAHRTLYRIGNYDLYNEDFRWVPDHDASKIDFPGAMLFAERQEWGPFVGKLVRAESPGLARPLTDLSDPRLAAQHAQARARWSTIRNIERKQIGAVNHYLEDARLELRRVALERGQGSPEYAAAKARFDERSAELNRQYERLAAEARALREEDRKERITLAEIGGREKTMALSEIVRFYPANELTISDKLRIYLSRWWEFLSGEPREANTEGGVLPAIFGTCAMTLLMVIFVAPFGVITALYLREYARQGRVVSIVRISVNNLAGVPSIVYGVFGLGFFAYVFGAGIDAYFYPERLPNPTFGTGGLLWASLTLALLTVPVVIVATEEALAAVPRSMREGSLACGASKWQTIRNIVLPRAMPGIMTGIILAMARGAGEVAPLMLVGVVKLAPELPVDGYFPFVHLSRSFMHLGFHIYDVGFQSRNSEAGKPMVFVTTLLLIALIAAMNAFAIVVRNRSRWLTSAS